MEKIDYTLTFSNALFFTLRGLKRIIRILYRPKFWITHRTDMRTSDIIYRCLLRDKSFKVLIAFHRGEFIRPNERYPRIARGAIVKPEIASESNSSPANQSNTTQIPPPSSVARIPRAFVVSSQTEMRPNCLPTSHERACSLYSYSRLASSLPLPFLSLSLSSSTPQEVCREFLLACEIGSVRLAFRKAEAEAEVPLTRTIIRLHQRFLPWRSWNFAHLGRIPTGSSLSSFQPQRHTTTSPEEVFRNFSRSLRPHNPQIASDFNELVG